MNRPPFQGEALRRAWPPHRSPQGHSRLREAQKSQAGFCTPRAGWRQGPEGGPGTGQKQAYGPPAPAPGSRRTSPSLANGARAGRAGPLPAGGVKKPVWVLPVCLFVPC